MKYEFYGKMFDTLDKAESFKKQVIDSYLESAIDVVDRDQHSALILLKSAKILKKMTIYEVSDDIDRDN